jgi:hypothetical protein
MNPKLFEILFRIGVLLCCGAGIMPYVAKGATLMVYVLVVTGIVFTGVGMAGRRYYRKLGIK